jgi:hypothetical protein
MSNKCRVRCTREGRLIAERMLFMSKFKCEECEKTEDTERWRNGDKLLEQKLCQSCSFWMELVRKAGSRDSVRVDGAHFMIFPDVSDGYRGFVGFGGDRFDIQFKNGRKITTKNLWHQGKIPERFRDRLFDNAEFCSLEGKA